MDLQRERDVLITIYLHYFQKILKENEILKKENEELRELKKNISMETFNGCGSGYYPGCGGKSVKPL